MIILLFDVSPRGPRIARGSASTPVLQPGGLTARASAAPASARRHVTDGDGVPGHAFHANPEVSRPVAGRRRQRHAVAAFVATTTLASC